MRTSVSTCSFALIWMEISIQILLEHSVAELGTSIKFPYYHSRHADHQITCTEYAGKSSDRGNKHDTNAHGISLAFLRFQIISFVIIGQEKTRGNDKTCFLT